MKSSKNFNDRNHGKEVADCKFHIYSDAFVWKDVFIMWNRTSLGPHKSRSPPFGQQNFMWLYSSKSFENLKNKKIYPKSCFFVSFPLTLDSFRKNTWQKFETCLHFTSFGNHYYIWKEISTQINRQMKIKKS